MLRKMREIIGWEEGDGTFSPGMTLVFTACSILGNL